MTDHADTGSVPSLDEGIWRRAVVDTKRTLTSSVVFSISLPVVAAVATIVAVMAVNGNQSLFVRTVLPIAAGVGAVLALAALVFLSAIVLAPLRQLRDVRSLLFSRGLTMNADPIKTAQTLGTPSAMLLALVEVGKYHLALTQLAELWPASRVDSRTAAKVLDVVMCADSSEISDREGALMLYKHSGLLLDTQTGTFDWPGSLEWGWPARLSARAQELIVAALVEVLLSSDPKQPVKWSPLNAVVAHLGIYMRTNPADVARAELSSALRILIPLCEDDYLEPPNNRMNHADLQKEADGVWVDVSERLTSLARERGERLQEWKSARLAIE